MNVGASQLLQIACSPQDGGAEPKKARAQKFRDKTRGRAKQLVASGTRLKRKAENQFVVEGEEKVLGATSGDVEVLRSYVLKGSQELCEGGANQGRWERSYSSASEPPHWATRAVFPGPQLR